MACSCLLFSEKSSLPNLSPSFGGTTGTTYFLFHSFLLLWVMDVRQRCTFPPGVAMADDILDVNKMIVRPWGKQRIMRNTV